MRLFRYLHMDCATKKNLQKNRLYFTKKENKHGRVVYFYTVSNCGKVWESYSNKTSDASAMYFLDEKRLPRAYDDKNYYETELIRINSQEVALRIKDEKCTDNAYITLIPRTVFYFNRNGDKN